MVPVDASLRGVSKFIAAAASYSPNQSRWRARFRYGTSVAKRRTAAAMNSLGNHEVDVLLQVGATYEPPHSGVIPYALFCDWNMALSAQAAAASGENSRTLTASEFAAIDAEHARRYWNAAAIFTISERLRKSFIELYGISADRVHTTYAGPNIDLFLIEGALKTAKTNSSPTILFIAKEFHRKGGDLVAKAFASLRQKLPDARLVFAGTPTLPAELVGLENVDYLGVLDKNSPEQLKRLLAAFRNADVLVLPSRHDPFPTVIREAMFFGVPCIASNIWAMSEMIVDGETGFLIPPEDVSALKQRLEQILFNSNLRASFGKAAQLRAARMFSWNAVGASLHNTLEHLARRSS